jgi:hypothetical protein
MALPIRLIVGPDNLMEIPLEAQSLDITVDRNASAFPTPNNIVGRVAIDTNIPAIGIEIGGIFHDDTNNSFDVETTRPAVSGGDIVFNFASTMPTTNFVTAEDFRENVQWHLGQLDDFHVIQFPKNFAKSTSAPTSDINIDDIEDRAIYGSMLNLLSVESNVGNDPISAINHPSAGTYSAGSTSIDVDQGINFKVKDRIHLANGTFVGTITGISTNTLTFSEGTKVALPNNTDLHSFKTTVFSSTGQVIGSVVDFDSKLKGYPATKMVVDKIKLDGFFQPVYKDVKYYLVVNGTAPPLEEVLHDKSIFLYPNHWRMDLISKSEGEGNGVCNGPEPIAVRLKFSNEMAHADHQNQKFANVQVAGSHPSIIQEGRHYEQVNGGIRVASSRGRDVIVKVPIGGISTHAVNGNPASTLALIVKKALELTTDVMNVGFIDEGTGETIPDAFSVQVSGPILKVKQKVRPINANLMSVLEPCARIGSAENYNFGKALAQIEFFTDNYGVYSVSANSKSAGDKVQDLIGLVSNAKKNRDLIRGIQIPYDSLIQSDAVTPTARNFFLTFGEQDPDAKGSAGNTLDATHTMIPGLLPGDLGGDPLEDKGSGILDNIAEFGEAIGAIASFVKNFIGDTFITLLSDPHGNDGGIRIVPEKLHVRYDAGNNYYAFNLRLLASDFVIGV